MDKIIGNFTSNGVNYVVVKFKGAACTMTESEYNKMCGLDYNVGKETKAS